MKCFHYLAVAAVFSLLMTPAAAPAADDVQQFREKFASIIDDLNDNSFEKFNRAIVKNDMISRIYGSRLIDQNVKQAFSSDFAAAVQEMFVSAFPPSRKEILGTLIDFQFEGDQGRAVVRYAASGYRFSYHVYELQRGAKDRLHIVDWIDYYRGNRFSDDAGAALVMAMPSRAATRNLVEDKSLSDGEVFQVAELFKAVRDNKAPRFFQIIDDLDEDILKDKTLMQLDLRFALISGDTGRIESAVRRVLAGRPDDALYSLRLNDYFIPARRYQEAIDALVRLQEAVGVQDGASESVKASAALAMGNLAEAETYAVQATVNEPELALSWWSLLRVRTRAGDYSGATEALTRLEDDFGQSLDPRTLRRDPFLKVLAEQPEYLDWRAARNPQDRKEG